VPRTTLRIAYAGVAVAATALAGALALSAAAHVTTGAPAPDAGDTGSVSRLTDAAGRYVHVDYDPLASPAEAVKQADLIVTGTLVGVTDGIAVQFPDPAMTGAAGTFATFVVQVDKVIDRDDAATAAGQRIYVAVDVSTQTNVRELAALNPAARVGLVLSDISGWKPHPTATVKRPAGIPAGARLYAPYPDGLWLQGPRDTRMSSVHADLADLRPAWGAPRTVDEFAARLAAAAAKK
jgi:hypothetical protein